jgi:hypothetical protein
MVTAMCTCSAYFFDPDSKNLLAFLAEQRLVRINRVRDMIDKLRALTSRSTRMKFCVRLSRTAHALPAARGWRGRSSPPVTSRRPTKHSISGWPLVVPRTLRARGIAGRCESSGFTTPADLPRSRIQCSSATTSGLPALAAAGLGRARGVPQRAGRPHHGSLPDDRRRSRYRRVGRVRFSWGSLARPGSAGQVSLPPERYGIVWSSEAEGKQG